MQLVNEELVHKRGNQIYLECVKQFGEERVLGVFTIGLYNYNAAESMDEVQYMAIYIPTFEDLCMQIPETENRGDYLLRDVRAIYLRCQEISGSSLELSYALYKKINLLYLSIYKEYFLKHKDEMGRKCYFFKTDAIKIKMEEYISNGDIFGAARLRIAAEQFSKGASMEECFRPTQSYINTYLESIKHGFLKIEPDTLLSEVDNILNSYSELELSNFTSKQIKLGVISIIDASLKKKVDMETFESQLTPMEKKAFDVIKENLDENKEACLSISKLYESTSISRPVWKNLFLKMEREQFAEIQNMGVKGTYIKLL